MLLLLLHYVQNVMVDWHLQNKFVDQSKPVFCLFFEEKNQIDSNAEVSKETQSVVYKRYYHVFYNGELEFLCSKIENIRINQIFFEHANWCIEIERLY